VITGTGFPKVFYLKYDMYRNAWPLLALATHQQALAKNRNGHTVDLGQHLLANAPTSNGSGKNGGH
jgi:hypothetical protein